MARKTPAQLDREITEALRGTAKPPTDLFALAEQIQRENPRRFGDVYFEAFDDGTGRLKLETKSYPTLIVLPTLRGRWLRSADERPDKYTVSLSWGDADIDLGEYEHPHPAVRHAMDVARWSEADLIRRFRS